MNEFRLDLRSQDFMDKVTEREFLVGYSERLRKEIKL